MILSTKSNELSVEKNISFAINFLLTWPILNMFLLNVVKPQSNTMFLSLMSILYVVYLFIWLINFKSIVNRLGKSSFIILLICSIVVCLNLIFFPINHEFLIPLLFNLFIKLIPGLLLGLAIRDFGMLFKGMYRFSFFQLLVIGLMIILTKNYDGYNIQNSMEWSYAILVPTIVLVASFFNKQNFYDLFIAIAAIAYIFLYGSRGPLLCLVIFVMLYLIRNSIRKDKKAIFMTIIIGIFISIMTLFINQILNFIQNILIKFNIYSRNLVLINASKLNDGNGRNIIFDYMFTAIEEKPITGWGLAGDRYINYINQFSYYYANGSSDQTTYAHNIFLELIVQFGIILGVIFSIILLLYSIKSFLTKENTKGLIFIVFFSIGMLPLMLSYSYLIWLNFWLFMGVMINLSLRKRKHSAID